MSEAVDEITPQFRDEREKALFSLAQDGMMTEQFLKSATGRIILDRMHEEVDEAMLKLLTEEDADKAKKLREQAAIATKAVEWCLQAIKQGDEAYQQLTVEND